jgi:hypothetical protein
MDDATLRRYAPLSGVIAVVLYVISNIVAMSDSPDFADNAREITEYYVDSKGEIIAGGLIGVVSVPFFIWFAASLRTAIARLEGGTTRLASTAFGASIAAITAGTAAVMVGVMGALRVDEQDIISPATATVYYDVSQILAFAAVPALFAAALFATALASLRYRAILPVWLAYATIVLGILDLIPPISWLGTLIGILWVLVVSIMLYLQGATVGSGEAPARAATAPATPPPPPGGGPAAA